MMARDIRVNVPETLRENTAQVRVEKSITSLKAIVRILAFYSHSEGME